MAHDVFISYSSEDKATAEAVLATLEGKGFKCWIAPRDILPGVSYGGAIIDAIRESRVMVFIFSLHSNSSQHVMRELECAVNRDACIIPFRIEDVHPSKSIEYFITASQWLDAFPQPTEKHFEILAETVKQLLARKGEGEVAETPEEVKEVEPPGGKDTQIPVTEGLREEGEVSEFEKDLRVAENLLRRKQWVSCIRECGALFEKALRKLLNDLLDSSVDTDLYDRISSAQRRIGEGKTGFERFELGELISLYTETQVFNELRKHLTSNLQKIRGINWKQVVEWYNASRHRRNSTSLGEDDARQMFYWIKVFLYDCELAGKISTVAPVPGEAISLQECPCCGQPLETDWSFCPQCGVALKVTCEACHRTLAPDFRICPYCETPVRRRSTADIGGVQRAKEEYRIFCVGAYLDEVMNVRERILLDKKRLELGLNTEEAESIERQCAPENIVEYTRLVEGALVDGIIDDAESVFLQKKAKKMNIDPWVAEQIKEEVIAKSKGTLGNQR